MVFIPIIFEPLQNVFFQNSKLKIVYWVCAACLTLELFSLVMKSFNCLAMTFSTQLHSSENSWENSSSSDTGMKEESIFKGTGSDD